MRVIDEYASAVDAIDDLVGRVFGRAAGDNPDVYGGDYDDFLALSGKCRSAVTVLRTSTSAPDAAKAHEALAEALATRKGWIGLISMPADRRTVFYEDASDILRHLSAQGYSVRSK